MVRANRFLGRLAGLGAQFNWSRPIEPSCLFCHASQIRRREGTLNAHADPAFNQNGMLASGVTAKMVNPVRLAPERRDAVCAQRNLTGQSRVARAGRQLTDRRHGDLLSSSMAGDFQANSHVEKLAQSGCKRGAGAWFWCGTCHDPNSVPPPSERAAWFRTKCLNCHEATKCVRGFDRAGCHGPLQPKASTNT